MARSAKTTTDHGEIQRWVKARGGYPAHVKRTATRNDPGVLRIDYPGYSGGQSLERITWSSFFEWFERNNLALLYQDTPRSRFSKLVAREPDAAIQRRGTSSRKRIATPQHRSARGGRNRAVKQPRQAAEHARTGALLDLNKATERQLERVFEIDGTRAARLVKSRPFRTWDDVKRVPGFGEGLVENIREAGGRIRSRAR
jgi:hypothetical protein